MKIHHLNCTTLNLRFAKIFDGQRNVFDGSLSCVTHCILVESNNAGLVLVDASFSIQDSANPRQVPFVFRFLFRPPWKADETAITNIKKLGYSPRDVRHVLLTHLDYDHANGLIDFPWATAHVYDLEVKSALSGKSMQDLLRYNRIRLKKHDKWEIYNTTIGDSWHGLNKVSPIKGLDNDFAIVPLIGHSAGHAGIAIRADNGWLLHAGDAYMMHAELQASPVGPSHSGLFHFLMKDNGRLRKESLGRLSALYQNYGTEVTIFSAHDKEEFENMIKAENITSHGNGHA